MGMRLWPSVRLGCLAGAAAWSAYATGEFAVSSLLVRFARPYSVFPAWHWELTALLLAAYLVAGVLAGAVAGLAVYALSRWTAILRNGDPRRPLRAAGTLTLVLAFTVNLLTAPPEHGKFFFVLVCAVFTLLLAASAHSSKWSGRFGLLTHPWIVAATLLGVGQEYGLAKLQEDGSLASGRVGLLSIALAGLLLALLIAAVLFGRRAFAQRMRGRLVLDWSAVALASILAGISALLAHASPAVTTVHAASSPRHGQSNLVILILDTVRADHLSVYGYPRNTTPNLEALAKESVVYTNTIAPSDMTLSSHASLFTGMYPSWHGAHCQPPETAYGRELSGGTLTLAEMLSDRGYTTVGVSANLYLRDAFGLQRGFQQFRIPRPVPVLSAESWYLLRRGMRRVLSPLADTAQFDRLYSRAEDVNATALSLLDDEALERGPFLLFANYMETHFPYVPPSPFDRLFPGKNGALTQDDLEQTQQAVIQGKPMSAAVRRHCLSQYDGGVAADDAQIGRLVAWLKHRGVYDNTLIVVASDHGEAFGEKNLVLHANSAYQNLLHVALLIKFPKGAHAGVVSEPVSLIDVVPTVLNALGLPVPQAVQGRNLLAPSEPRALFSESFPCPALHAPECPREGCMTRAIVTWPYKYIASSSGKRALYDIAADPGETHDISAARREVRDAASLALARWIDSMPTEARQPNNMNADALRTLKSLGYVQ